MTPERFCEFLDAYGADLRRWPREHYAAACALAEMASPELLERMAQAAALDALLCSDSVEAPDEALIQRITAGVPTRWQPAADQADPWWRPRWLWPAGLAGAGLVGSLAGAVFVSIALPHTPSYTFDRLERGTAFSAVPADWSEK